MSRGLSQQQQRILALLRSYKRALDVTEELLPELGLEPDDSTRRSLLRAVRLLEQRGLVTVKRVPSDRGGHPRMLVSDPLWAAKPRPSKRHRTTSLSLVYNEIAEAIGRLLRGYPTDYGIEDAGDEDVFEVEDELAMLKRWVDASLEALDEFKGYARKRETNRKLERMIAGGTEHERASARAALRRKNRKQMLEQAAAGPEAPPPAKRKPSEARKRKRYLHAKRRAGDTSTLMNMRLAVMNMQEVLEDVDLPTYGVEGADDEMVFEVYDYVMDGREWVEAARADLDRFIRRRGLRETPGNKVLGNSQGNTYA